MNKDQIAVCQTAHPQAKLERVSVKGKLGNIEKVEIYDYYKPSNIQAMITIDGETLTNSHAQNERKTSFQDFKRKLIVASISDQAVADAKISGPFFEAMKKMTRDDAYALMTGMEIPEDQIDAIIESTHPEE